MADTEQQLRVPAVVVTGSRNFRDGDRIEADLRALLPLGLRHVAQGGSGVECGRCHGDGCLYDERNRKMVVCPHCNDTGLPTGHCEICTPLRISSADALAWRASLRLQLGASVYRVDERLDGKWPVCGPRRNRRMLKAERPALVLAYPSRNSKGTWSCIEEAWRMRIPVLVWVHWAKGSGATQAVVDAMKARGVSLIWSKEQIAGVACDNLGVTDRDGHRVFVGDPDLSDMLPQELDG